MTETSAGTPAGTTTLDRVTALVAPVVADLHLDLYDIEFRGGTLRVTIDTPPGSPAGVTLDEIALATRLISRELDHDDPMPGHYTLEVTSPGLERNLRTPAHFRREVGKQVAVRLRDIGHGGERRLSGTLVAADEAAFTVRLDGSLEDRAVSYGHVDRAKTVFVWAAAPKPGGKSLGGKKPTAKKAAGSMPATSPTTAPTTTPTTTPDEEENG